MKKYEYFVSYTTHTGAGNVSITSSDKKISMKLIQEIQRLIENKFNYKKVIINNIIKL